MTDLMARGQSQRNASKFYLSTHGARDKWQRTGDDQAFHTDCIYAAIKYALAEAAITRPALKPLSNSIYYAKDFIKSAIEAAEDCVLRGPHQHEDALDYIASMRRHLDAHIS
ncbi:MAG: hypothetical protein ABL907_19820, partial [Hyphomicrobium sp.]